MEMQFPACESKGQAEAEPGKGECPAAELVKLPGPDEENDKTEELFQLI